MGKTYTQTEEIKDRAWIQYSTQPSFRSHMIKVIVRRLGPIVGKSDLHVLRSRWDFISSKNTDSGRDKSGKGKRSRGEL
jgi:hypothetical protein